MCLHRAWGDAEPLGYLVIRAAGCDEGNNLPLPIRDRRTPLDHRVHHANTLCGRGRDHHSPVGVFEGVSTGVKATLGSVIHGLDHVQVAAPPNCEADARRFYGELLGLSELEKPEPLRARGGVWFDCGDQQLHVGVDEAFVAARKAHPALAVSAYDELRRRLRDAGIDVTDDDAIPGVRRSYVHDPWGNRLELVAMA